MVARPWYIQISSIASVGSSIAARRVSSQLSVLLHFIGRKMHVRNALFSLALLPDPLRESSRPVFCLFPHFPPIRRVYFPHTLLQTPVPPILGHLHQSDWDYSRRRFGFWLFGFVEFGE